MSDQIKNGIDSWFEFTEMRYKAEKSFWDALDRNTIKLENKPLNEIVNNSIKFSKIFMETRYNLEREFMKSIVGSFDDKASTKNDNGGVKVTKVDDSEGAQQAGTIKVEAPVGEKVIVPVALKNDFNSMQRIKIMVSDIINIATSKPISETLKVSQPEIEIAAEETGMTQIGFTIDGRIFKPGENYAARIEVHGFEKKALDLFIQITKKGGELKVLFEPTV